MAPGDPTPYASRRAARRACAARSRGLGSHAHAGWVRRNPPGGVARQTLQGHGIRVRARRADGDGPAADHRDPAPDAGAAARAGRDLSGAVDRARDRPRTRTIHAADPGPAPDAALLGAVRDRPVPGDTDGPRHRRQARSGPVLARRAGLPARLRLQLPEPGRAGRRAPPAPGRGDLRGSRGRVPPAPTRRRMGRDHAAGGRSVAGRPLPGLVEQPEPARFPLCAARAGLAASRGHRRAARQAFGRSVLHGPADPRRPADQDGYVHLRAAGLHSSLLRVQAAVPARQIRTGAIASQILGLAFRHRDPGDARRRRPAGAVGSGRFWTR